MKKRGSDKRKVFTGCLSKGAQLRLAANEPQQFRIFPNMLNSILDFLLFSFYSEQHSFYRSFDEHPVNWNCADSGCLKSS